MQTDFIRTALKVAELGHYEPAAKEMFVTHYIARRRIKLLEIELGFPLFMVPNGYSRNGVVPTERGAKWLTFARKAMEMLDLGAVEFRRVSKVKARQRKAS